MTNAARWAGFQGWKLRAGTGRDWLDGTHPVDIYNVFVLCCGGRRVMQVLVPRKSKSCISGLGQAHRRRLKTAEQFLSPASIPHGRFHKTVFVDVRRRKERGGM